MNDNAGLPVVTYPRSDYFNRLQGTAKQRYEIKTLMIQGVDPYCLTKDGAFSVKVNTLPTVEEIDIFSYFLSTFSSYSAEKFKSYKSLQAQQYISAGYVGELSTYKIGDKFVAKAKVRDEN